MPIDPSIITLFAVSVIVIAVTPGPDMAYVLAHTFSQGARAGLVASLGMALGMVVHTTAATAGLATLLQSSPVAYDLIRYAGAAYLIYIGIRFWQEAGHPDAMTQQTTVRLRTVLWRAAVTNLLNPKIVLFYVAFLPQFVDPRRGSASLQFLILGAMFVLIGLVIDSAIALLGGQVNGWIQHPAANWMLKRVAGTVFVGLAVRLAL